LENKPEYTFDDVWELIKTIPPEDIVYVFDSNRVEYTQIYLTGVFKKSQNCGQTPRTVLNEYVTVYTKSSNKPKPLTYDLITGRLDIEDLHDVIFIAPLEEVPLYINNIFVQAAVKWRLSIGK
jgi:hypothetical protein